MSKLQTGVKGAKGFFNDVIVEMKKTTWPERNELVQSTLVVIVSVILLSAFVAISDKVLVSILDLLIPSV